MDKSIFNFKIQYQDGKTIDLHEDKNLWVSSFRIFSPSPNHTTESVEGRNGSVYLGTTLEERKITATIMVEALDYKEFDLIRDELFNIFNPLNEFYIIRDLQPGKRMKVSVASDFDIDYLTLEDGEFDIEFIIHSVFLESIGTTLEPVTFDPSIIQFGQDLILDETMYTHTTTSFQIYNASNITIDPTEHDLKITYKGTSNNLKIKNLTTGDEWGHNGTSSTGDTIILDGIRSTKNGLSIFRDSNRKLITLAPKLNKFELTGTSGNFEISFDFRFLFL
nr:hypothetical protein 4 [Bacillaceae bacterium]